MRTIFDYLEHYSEAITALATVVIAIYTVVLAMVSNRQSKLIAAQLRLGREEFIATHRPQLRLGRYYLMKPLAAGERPSMIFVAQNVGHSVAHITEVRSASIVLEIEGRFPKNMGIPSGETLNRRLESGQSEVLPTNGTDPLTEEENEAVNEGKKLLYFVGVVVYLDDVGNRREVGFCRKFNTWTQELGSWPTDYEYEF